jgi:hypothetical protein
MKALTLVLCTAVALFCFLTGCNSPSPDPTNCGFWGPLDPTCNGWTFSSSPAPEAEAIDLDGGVCIAAAMDSDCLACIKTSCCAAGTACLAETECACQVTCRTAGEAPQSCGAVQQCGATDTVYDTLASCTRASCASQCPDLQ